VGDLHQVSDKLGIIHINFAIEPESEGCLLMIKYTFCWLCDQVIEVATTQPIKVHVNSQEIQSLG
jgi:hypothetical protein